MTEYHHYTVRLVVYYITVYEGKLVWYIRSLFTSLGQFMMAFAFDVHFSGLHFYHRHCMTYRAMQFRLNNAFHITLFGNTPKVYLYSSTFSSKYMYSRLHLRTKRNVCQMHTFVIIPRSFARMFACVFHAYEG